MLLSASMGKRHRKERLGNGVEKGQSPEVSRRKITETTIPPRQISSKVKIVILLVLAGIGLGVGGYLISSGKDKAKTPDLPKKSSPYVAPQSGPDPDDTVREFLDKKQLTAQLIPQVERSFADWEQKLMPLIDSIEDEYLREQLKTSFVVMKKNKENPNRNYFTHYEETGGVQPGGVLEKPYFFLYDVDYGSKGSNYFAAFSPATLNVTLFSSFDPTNPT